MIYKKPLKKKQKIKYLPVFYLFIFSVRLFCLFGFFFFGFPALPRVRILFVVLPRFKRFLDSIYYIVWRGDSIYIQRQRGRRKKKTRLAAGVLIAIFIIYFFFHSRIVRRCRWFREVFFFRLGFCPTGEYFSKTIFAELRAETTAASAVSSPGNVSRRSCSFIIVIFFLYKRFDKNNETGIQHCIFFFYLKNAYTHRSSACFLIIRTPTRVRTTIIYMVFFYSSDGMLTRSEIYGFSIRKRLFFFEGFLDYICIYV